jgi:uncharacterized phage protein (TIGR02218 family)
VKTLPAALAAHYAQQTTTVATLLKVTRSDSVVAGFTSHDRPLVFDGVTYNPGFDLSSLSSTSSLAVDNLELSIIPGDDEDVLIADLVNGKWDNAFFQLMEVNIGNLASDQFNLLKNGNLGQVQFKATKYVVEFRSLTQQLQQTQGIVTQKTCRARLGDAKCTKSLTAFTVSGTVDTSTDARHFTDAARAEADDYFTEGLITLTSGDNAGLTRKVKLHAAGAFTLTLPFPYDIAVGTTYTMIAGCRKRLAEDCVTKFANGVNFQGEPHLPGLDALSKRGGAATQAASTPDLPGGDAPDYTGSGP